MVRSRAEQRLGDAYCWGYRQACADHDTKPRDGDERQAKAEAAWEHDRRHLIDNGSRLYVTPNSLSTYPFNTPPTGYQEGPRDE